VKARVLALTILLIATALIVVVTEPSEMYSKRSVDSYRFGATTGSENSNTDRFVEEALRRLAQAVRERYPGCEPVVRRLFLVVRSEGLYVFLHASYYRAVMMHTKAFIKEHLRSPDREYSFSEPMLLSASIEAFVDKDLNVHIREIGRVYLIGLRKTREGSTTVFKWVKTPGVKLKFTFKPLADRLEELKESKLVGGYRGRKPSYRSMPLPNKLQLSAASPGLCDSIEYVREDEDFEVPPGTVMCELVDDHAFTAVHVYIYDVWLVWIISQYGKGWFLVQYGDGVMAVEDESYYSLEVGWHCDLWDSWPEAGDMYYSYCGSGFISIEGRVEAEGYYSDGCTIHLYTRVSVNGFYGTTEHASTQSCSE